MTMETINQRQARSRAYNIALRATQAAGYRLWKHRSLALWYYLPPDTEIHQHDGVPYASKTEAALAAYRHMLGKDPLDLQSDATSLPL